jgi:hypothetical protein
LQQIFLLLVTFSPMDRYGQAAGLRQHAQSSKQVGADAEGSMGGDCGHQARGIRLLTHTLKRLAGASAISGIQALVIEAHSHGRIFCPRRADGQAGNFTHCRGAPI